VSRETLRIPPAPGSQFIAAPEEIFRPLWATAGGFTWVLWGETQMTARPESDLNVLELERRVESSPHGVAMAWPSVSELLSQLVQVIDGTFIGSRDPAAVPRYPETPLEVVHRDEELVVTAFDSSWWWVSAEAEVTARVKAAFPHAEPERAFQ
jgi:hypothetical protein